MRVNNQTVDDGRRVGLTVRQLWPGRGEQPVAKEMAPLSATKVPHAFSLQTRRRDSRGRANSLQNARRVRRAV